MICVVPLNHHFFYHFYLSLKFGCLKAGDHSFLAGKIDVSFQTHIRFLPISPSKCLVKSCLMKATSELSILTLRSSNNGNNLLQKFRGFYGKIIQHQRGISTKKNSPSLRTPDGTRPGKRLHNELERSTMRKSWENPLFRLGHGFNSYVNVYQRVMEPYGNHPIIILIQNLHLSSSGLGNFPIDASKPLLRWFIHGRFIETMVYRC